MQTNIQMIDSKQWHITGPWTEVRYNNLLRRDLIGFETNTIGKDVYLTLDQAIAKNWVKEPENNYQI